MFASGLMADEKNENGDSWRQVALKWVFQQGVPTVLLCAITAMIGYGLMQVPSLVFTVIEKIDNGYQKNAATLKEATENQAETVDKLLDRIDRRNGP